MEWKNVNLREEKPEIPGCININTNDGSFVSATFRLADKSLLRLRQANYGTVVEKQVRPTEKLFIVTAEVGGTKLVQEFKEEAAAEKFKEALDGADTVELKETEREVLVSVNLADTAVLALSDLPF